MHKEIDSLAAAIGYRFRDEKLLERAVTHSSFSNERKLGKGGNYERLEFLGDAVLELVCSAHLYAYYPDKPEGELTRIRASLVCEPALAFCAHDLSLSDYIRLGKGEEAQGGRERESVIADVMEAITGAIYLDGGFEAARDFIMTFILNDIENKGLFYDAKTVLQETVQGKGMGKLEYKLLREEGPEHNKLFTSAVYLNGDAIGEGTGRNKKTAEQNAALEAIQELRKGN